ncbi:putative FAD-linked oxidoreductase [Roseivivax jejudonensis]|uniref:D-lactate dehydrogenase (cytochrome) n=1 Tax=Roseivivax jejudonensis TaxID=1529041 RepID=A0A1X6YKY3_9RHOB|nr:FAD-linked oxidase C-terminal domain-containing protein [Roseivivax jejudonensis]SLN22615.1 putative FAD-linked oxidoreductase [Roseivivax jejudonensis]
MTDRSDTIARLRALLGDRLSTGASVREMHGRDEAYSAPALPEAVAFPETTAEVSEIVRICAASDCPVVPFGVGTSLEGHVIPLRGGISIDLGRMSRILEVHEADLDVTVEPGVTRKALNEALRASGLMFTVDPGADATLGGMAATRASGTNAVRYGTMRETVLGLEVVLADGTVIETGTRAKKSSAGYDLTHLFVGSEGTLGIITRLTLRLHGIPEQISAATAAFPSVAAAVDTVILAIQMGIPLARVELLDAVQMRGMAAYNPDLGLAEAPHLFLEFHGSPAGVEEQVAQFREIAEAQGAADFAWASRPEDRSRLWDARHNAYYAGKALRPGADSMVTDVCVPISALAECIAAAQEAADEAGLLAPLVGHVGDGNFHMLILIEPDNSEELARAKDLAHRINRLALSFGGTVTGEHGIGSGKMRYMEEEHGPAWAVMGTIKRALDPKGILNPGKLVQQN